VAAQFGRHHAGLAPGARTDLRIGPARLSSALQVFGGYGCVSDFPVERIHRDVRVCQIYEGTSEVQKILIGRALG
jgi:alkylation response protein AidB-like acyl-CoA dehydrogenase